MRHRIVMFFDVAKPEQVRLLHHSVIDPLSKVNLYLKASFLPLAKIVASQQPENRSCELDLLQSQCESCPSLRFT
jgi:hypothetical protein